MIPLPFDLRLEDGKFILDSNTKISAPLDLFAVSQYLNNLLKTPTGFELQETDDSSETNLIILELDETLKDLNPEGYLLHITPDAVTIKAPQPAGVFYGIQTLRQLFPVEIESSSKIQMEWSIPCVSIEDSPRFSWRGFMLDVSRHFFDKEFVKKLLDIMASLKFNVFHWHLTDDQGWRIEIKKYPLLTEIGSKRRGTIKSRTERGFFSSG